MKGVWFIGFLVNVFLLGSVFDIHFKSPIVTVEITHRSSTKSPPPAKRVVFFVADGLRADTFYQNPNLRPYLSNLIKGDGGVAWGVSHTRVPTESRPGHIALFAGFYEDPSAVFTGWKNNLVEFDSVFNRSDGGVAFGSPDVVNMFSQGVAKSKIYSETYPSDWQDFLESNSSVLDTWVFDKFKTLVQRRALPSNDNALIFLHLLGIDNTGHATKPHSIEYKTGLTIVDDIVAKVERIVAEYYGDNKTLFVFTSDHGMTDWGSHGSGSSEETETPIVVWGPGIKKTENLLLNQADIAALVAGSLGSTFPTNSIGKFPTSIWKDDKFAYSALRANVLQLKELMNTKKERVAFERNFPLLEYPDEGNILQKLTEAEEFSKFSKIKEATSSLDSAFSGLFKATIYYERYNQQLMSVFAVLTFALLMTLVAFSSLSFDPKQTDRVSDIISIKLMGVGIIIAAFITKGLIGWSLWKLLYSLVPIYLALVLSSILLNEKSGSSHKVSGRGEKKMQLGLSVFLSVLGVQMLVLSFWERSVLSVALVLNLGWILWANTEKRFTLQLVAVGTLALFPAVPIIGRATSPFFTTVGPLVSISVVALCLWGMGSNSLKKRDKLVLGTQLLLLGSVSLLTHFPSSLPTRIVAWASLLISPIAPTLTSSKMTVIRLTSIFLGLGTSFSFLGVSYETLFFPSLFLVLLLFLKLELENEEGRSWGWSEFISHQQNFKSSALSSCSSSGVNVHRTFRRAWLHLFFVLLSFFGTGNIGSVSSFDPSSTRCFVSVFNPWMMMLLMLNKVVAPFLLVSSFWRALLPNTRDVERNFGILLLLCQGMSLNMFFRVRNQGSWLDIGMSISHFVIVQATTLFLLLFHFIANYLVTHELRGHNILPISRDKVS